MKRKRHSTLWLWFTGVVFATITAVFLIVSALWLIFFRVGIVKIDPLQRHLPIMLSFLVSLLIGTVIALFVGKLMIRPIQRISEAFDELSVGNFTVRVPENERISEIRDMAKKFNAMTRELSNMETLRTDFVANVSHEFKTPLSSIEGYAALLQNKSLSEEKRSAYVDKILDNSRRLSTLSSNVLMLSRLENQEIVAGRTEFRLDEQLRQVILSLEDKWSAKNIEFDMELPCVMYYGNEGLIDRVWGNLIDNAIKHSNEGGSIRIELLTNAESVCVSVIDHGSGMSEDVQKHIFEKFYQGDTSHTAEGNGLGLPLVKRIVDMCEGKITVVSREGEGSTFTVRLPRSRKGI